MKLLYVYFIFLFISLFYINDVQALTSTPITANGTVTYYNVTSQTVNNIIEHRFYYKNHHFLTIIDDSGTFNMRPHPGIDVNGWGSSLYLQPFLPGANLTHTTIESITINAFDVVVKANGFVSKDVSNTYGIWNLSMAFSYDDQTKSIDGNGTYNIKLDNNLSSSTGDLNLYKLASNYLDNVPLLTGGNGDTGDMKNASVVLNSTNFIWIPENQPAHFPNNPTDFLSIDVSGNLNNVDTQAQGYQPIAPKYTPSLRVDLTTNQQYIPLIFGGIYDTSKSQLFFEDNVGITPLVLKKSLLTDYQFDLHFESNALPGDGNDRDFDGKLDANDNCPDAINPGQEDSNNNGIGDACDNLPSNYITVCQSGSCNYNNIDIAVDRANSGQVVYVTDKAVYREQVVIGLPVFYGKYNVTLDCNGATILGNGTFDSIGIHMSNGAYTLIKNCIVKNYGFGFQNWNGGSNYFVNNTAINNTYGFYMTDTEGVSVASNNATNNTYGIYYYWFGSNHIINNNLVKNNKIAGITMSWGPSNSLINGNVVKNNNIGIYSECPFGDHPAFKNNYTYNQVTDNTYGIDVRCSYDNRFFNNRLNGNGVGIIMRSSNNNTIYNNLFNNTINAQDGYINYWNVSKSPGLNIVGGPFVGGNFWHDYVGSDLNGDRLGDTGLPYKSNVSYGNNIINGGDYLPLTLSCSDQDNDGICDYQDNCLLISNHNQINTDIKYDNYGNICDPDFDDNEVVGISDLGVLRKAFGATLNSTNYNETIDMDSNGAIGASDLVIVRSYFGKSPGPSGII